MAFLRSTATPACALACCSSLIGRARAHEEGVGRAAQREQRRQAGAEGGVKVHQPDSARVLARRPQPLLPRHGHRYSLGQQQHLHTLAEADAGHAGEPHDNLTEPRSGRHAWQPEVTAHTNVRARLWDRSAVTRLLIRPAMQSMCTASSAQCATLCSHTSRQPSDQLYASNQSRKECSCGSCHRSPQNVKKDTAPSSRTSADQKHSAAPAILCMLQLEAAVSA